MSTNKENLRKIAKTKRCAVLNRSEKNCKIREKVIELLCEQNAESVFVYVSVDSEVDTRDIIAEAFVEFDVFVPYTFDGKMVPVRLDSSARLYNVDKHGNVYRSGEPNARDYLPIGDSGKYRIDVTITPMLAFNDELYRLGYGGGYYDKFFASCDTVKIGVAYDEQKVDDFTPNEYDVALDAIVTQSAVLRRQ